MKRPTVFATAFCLMASQLTAGNGDLVPLKTVIDQLENETNELHLINAIASRCGANRGYVAVRLTHSFAITGDAEEKALLENFDKTSQNWLTITIEAAQELNPPAQREDVLNAVFTKHSVQVQAYIKSAETQQALTGHYMPETLVEDGMICQNFEDQMPIFGLQ